MFALFILTNGFQHPPFHYKDMEAARGAVKLAMNRRYLKVVEDDFLETGESSEVAVVVGPGTVYRVFSMEELERKTREQRKTLSALQQGLISGQKPAEGYRIAITTGHTMLDPELEYPTAEAAKKALDVLKDQLGRSDRPFIEHVINNEDYVCIEPMPGMAFMLMSAKGADARRRMIVEQSMRAAQQQRAAANQPAPGKIILPGKN